MTKARMLTLLVVSAQGRRSLASVPGGKGSPGPKQQRQLAGYNFDNARAFWRIYCRLEAER